MSGLKSRLVLFPVNEKNYMYVGAEQLPQKNKIEKENTKKKKLYA